MPSVLTTARKSTSDGKAPNPNRSELPARFSAHRPGRDVRLADQVDDGGGLEHGSPKLVAGWRFCIKQTVMIFSRVMSCYHRERVNLSMRLQTLTDQITIVSHDDRRFVVARHNHTEAQLIYAITGVVAVTTERGVWVVPPSRAVWVPPNMEHATRSLAAVQFRALLINGADSDDLPQDCTVVEVTPLLRELILRLALLAERPREPPYVRAAVDLLLRELAFLPVEPLSLPRPLHAHLARFCDRLFDEPARAVSLEEASEALYMSRSSFMRLFLRETGLGFARWRQQARLLHALLLLAEGQSILNVALACGYDSPSAFSAMFRRALGKSPSDYFRR
jgi:AraC-like DNA-binding protein